MNIQDMLVSLIAYTIGVILVFVASWMSGMSMDSLVGWVAMGMAAGAGAKR